MKARVEFYIFRQRKVVHNQLNVVEECEHPEAYAPNLMGGIEYYYPLVRTAAIDVGIKCLDYAWKSKNLTQLPNDEDQWKQLYTVLSEPFRVEKICESYQNSSAIDTLLQSLIILNRLLENDVLLQAIIKSFIEYLRYLIKRNKMIDQQIKNFIMDLNCELSNLLSRNNNTVMWNILFYFQSDNLTNII
ncbi:unnamed protein product [Didymodactylos carnosus]|uniref:Uncharacterized protein n=1 Tax=Didymodactylos carnosus TaxID=1234261 RepID=A0A814BG22_9BILA|nr:unnamed protein product [Didymodactylos carnosus]CAF3706196.1 unnamed protein product [Didymodactylos carnosus]